MRRQTFVVDASLVQELGERLIARPAIALGELVKNAFDADATICRIEFGDDEIVVSDNGHGMTDKEFRDYWMRIGTTHKVDEHVSRRLKRPLTGSKGIGRLSAQFLATHLTLDSTPRSSSANGVHASVDWSTATPGAALSKVVVKWEAHSHVHSYAGDNRFGTRIALRRLKSAWDAAALEELGKDVWMLQSPFGKPEDDTPSSKRDDFDVEIDAPAIADALEAFDRTRKQVFDNWKARIRGSLDHGRVDGTASITVEFRKGYPPGSDKLRRFQASVRLPVGSSGRETVPLVDRASFEILVFKAERRQPGGISVKDLREYLAQFGNVSVYDAGFRLPYYGSRHEKVGEDWLAIAADQGRRLTQSSLLPHALQARNRYLLDLPAPGRIFGAVAIDTNHEGRAAKAARMGKRTYLEIQSGRDRLHDNEAFYQLRDLVRFSLDYYANRFRLLNLEAAERKQSSEPPSSKYRRALDLLEAAERKIPRGVFHDLRRTLSEAEKAGANEEEIADQRAALLAPLASAGMAALALHHEIARESAFLDRISGRLRHLASRHSIAELGEIAAEFDEAKRRLDSLRELFAPLLSNEDKSAANRLRLKPVVAQAVKGMSVLMPGVKFDYEGITMDLRLPLGSFAEWNGLLQNVLANAWNALLDSNRRQILFTAGRDRHGKEWLRVSDTGQGLGVPLSESPRLFEPFERQLEISPDKRSIAIGGEGLGLTIARMIARRRGAEVGFVEPVEGFSTTFELSWKGSRT